jgi:hypothetical protein
MRFTPTSWYSLAFKIFITEIDKTTSITPFNNGLFILELKAIISIPISSGWKQIFLRPGVKYIKSIYVSHDQYIVD